MKRVIPLLWVLCCTAIAGPAEPVALENGASPNGKYDVVLEADKDTPSYSKYEFKADNSPKLLLRELRSKKILQTLSYPCDPDSDMRPLREHTGIIWRPDSGALVINTSERFYSHMNVFVLNKKAGLFQEVNLPSYKSMTGFDVPKSEDLMARGHSSGTNWTEDGLLVYEIFLSPAGSYNGKDPLTHRVFLRLKPNEMEVVRHEPITDQ
jgi:hypothetical protein